MKHQQLFFLSLLILPTLIFAHGPSRQKVVEEIEINASPAKVWNVIRDFCSIKDWNPNIKNCQAIQGSEIGSVRMIEFENGEQITEKLFKFDPANKKMLYAMEKLEAGRVIKGMPVATLSSTITVTEHNGQAKVQFKGAFYRAFSGTQPPPDQTDEACIAAVKKLYRAGLEGIRAIAEK